MLSYLNAAVAGSVSAVGRLAVGLGARVWTDLVARGYQLGNADITIEAQVPKLAPHIDAMREILAGFLDVAPERVNVKATTTEGLGFVGAKQGMAAHAVVILEGRQ